MPNDIAKDLIRLAADMARATGLPSEFDDDHLPDRPRIYWLNCLSRTVDALRVYALRVRAGADEIESLRSRLAAADREATVLVVAMADQFGAPDNWKPLPDAAGMITQISNMVAGLREERALIVQRAENAEAALVEAEQEYQDARIVRKQLEARLAEADELHSRYVKAVGELAGMAARYDQFGDEAVADSWPVYVSASAYDSLLSWLAEANDLLRDTLPSVQSHIRKHRRSWEAAMKRGDEFHTRKHCEQMNKDLALEARIDAHLAREP